MRRLILVPVLLLLSAFGPMQPSSSHTLIDIATGRVPGSIPVRKFAINRDHSAAQEVWPVSGNMTYLTSPAAIELISSSVNDTAAGTHCQSVKIFGLDGNYDLIEDTIATNGTSASTATTQTYLRVYRAYCVEVGAYGNTNAGNITIRVSGAGSTQSYIVAGDGQSLTSHYTIPRGYTGYGMDVHSSVASNKYTDITFLYRVNATGSTPAWRTAAAFEGVNAGNDYTYWGMVQFPEKTDIRAVSDPAAVNTGASVDYIILLVRNNR